MDYTDAMIDLAKAVAENARAFNMLAWAIQGLEQRLDRLEAAVRVSS